MTYNDMMKTFQQRRRDYSFPSSELEHLNDEERKKVEERILLSCLDGDRSCFKHLPHIQFYDLLEVYSSQ